MQIPDAWVSRTLSVLRIAAALLLLQHGTSKFGYREERGESPPARLFVAAARPG